jgi:hypothetical protein
VSKHQLRNVSLPRKSGSRVITARCALKRLVWRLRDAASDAWHDQRLWGHGDRARYFGRSADLIRTVDKLSKVILDHPDADVRADRLIDLHDALEAAAIIGGCLETPAINRLRTAAVTEKSREKSAQEPRKTEIVEDQFSKLREKLPDKDFKKDGPWKTGHAPRLRQSVDQQFKQEGLRSLKADTIEGDTIGRYLAKLPFFSD